MRVRRGVGVVMGTVWCAVSSLAANAAQLSWTSESYEDKLIRELSQEEDPQDPEPRNDNGPLRSLTLQKSLLDESVSHFDQRNTTSVFSLNLTGWLQTENWGVTSAQLAASTERSSRRFALRQRYIPLNAGTLANVELGVIQAPQNGVLATQSRIAIPRTYVKGLSAQIVSSLDGARQIAATTGVVGQLAGYAAYGFTTSSERQTMISAQWDGWAFEALEGHSTQSNSTEDERAQKGYYGRSSQVGYQADLGSLKTLLRFVQSTGGDNTDTVARGMWTQFDWSAYQQEHSGGVYRLEPHLNWGGQAMPENLQGIFYRGRWSRRQLSLEAGLDQVASIQGPHSEGYYATLFGRYRLNRWNTVSAGLTGRSYLERGGNIFVDWRWLNAWGPSGMRLERASHAKESLSWARYEQEWQYINDWLPGGTLASSLAIGRQSDDTGPAAALVAANLNWSLPITERWQFNGTFGSERRAGIWSQWSTGLWVNWRPSRFWEVQAHLYRSSGSTRLYSSIDPLAVASAETSSHQSGRRFNLVARYLWDTGSSRTALGTSAGQIGGGRLSGVVFFDTNRTQTREASEGPAIGVSVVLDDRYVATTDELGKYEFPFVAPGVHTISVRNESLPLPWVQAQEGADTIQINVRGMAEKDFALQRSER